jgi:ribosome-associated heat shock protein Hsp15
VRVGESKAKPATTVAVGDTVQVKDSRRERVVTVVELLATRVGAPLAVLAYEDHSPPPAARTANPPTAVRDRGTGRPTKAERRQLDRLRGRDGQTS